MSLSIISNPTPIATGAVAGPAWAKNQPIYEVNLDVYGFAKGAALREYTKHLPTLKKMGVGLIWFMPLHPRGYKKGFGSAYSVRDYRDINPDLGTKDEFRQLVKQAHALGLFVLMDWVPNHTAWENPLTETHPEFYAQDAKGEIQQAGPWADVAQLNYGKPGAWNQPLWNEMRDSMAFWIREFGVDGFRCDVAGTAGKVPGDFWRWLRPQLDAIKPVFMLAEAEDAYLHPSFDMTYSWSLPPVLWDICAGRKPASAIDDVLEKERKAFPAGAILMRFLDNHDWHPHTDWGWGDKPAIPPDMSGGMPQVAPLMVLCTTLPGKPLLYNGQEMAFVKTNPPRQAELRAKSPVWSFYQRLLSLYQQIPAVSEGSFTKLALSGNASVYAFIRQHKQQRVLVMVNLSDRAQTVALKGALAPGTYKDWFQNTNKTVTLTPKSELDIPSWGYRVYVSQ
jgi:1,4-alpha-glucan branching enzyme